MLKHITILIFAAISLTCGAQTFTLTGKVTDELQQPLEFCTVACPTQSAVTMTNLKGEFTLTLQTADSVPIRFSMIGYQTKTRTLRNPKTPQKLRIMLAEDNTLGEIVITENKRQTSQSQEIKTKHLKSLPSTTGNAVEELIQTQAGVSTHNELSSQYNVRGGSFDENSVYLNGIELYRPFLVRSGQQEGLSAINSDMVQNILFSTGGYDAKYGDKMSSALDITYKRLYAPTTRLQLIEGSGSISLLGASAYLGLANRKLSWTNGFRYKTNAYLLGTLETKGEYRPSQLDYQSYLSYKPAPTWTLDLIANINSNHYSFVPSDRETAFGTAEDVKNFKVYFDGQEQDVFNTYFAAFNITKAFNNNNSELSLSGSMYHTIETESYDIQGQYWLTQTDTSENLGVGTYFQHARNYLTANVQTLKLMFKHKTRAHNVETAATYKHEYIYDRSAEYEMRDSAGYSIPHTGDDLYMVYSQRSNNTLNAHRFEAYAQDSYRFGSNDGGTRYTLNYGLRLAHWSFNRETILSPRLSLAVIPAANNNITLRAATGVYYQAPFYKELRDTTTINNTTYATLSANVKSQRSIHYLAALDYNFKVANRPFKFTAEAYYKALSNFIPYTIDNMRVVYYPDLACKGHIAGLDLKLYGEFVPGTDSWLSFSLMNTSMLIPDNTSSLGEATPIPLPTDQRFAINLYFTDYFPNSDRWKLDLKLAYADGLPFTAPHKELQTNTFRAPAYRRVDLGLSYLLYSKEHSSLFTLHSSLREANNTASRIPDSFRIWTSISALNLLGINNVNSYYWITDVTNKQYAVPNYLTGRQINLKLHFEF